MTKNHKVRRLSGSATLRIDIAGAVAVIGLTIACYMLGVKPVLAQRDALAQQQTVLGARKQEAVETQQALRALQRESDHLRDSLEHKTLRLSSSQQTNERMDELSRSLADHGLMVEELSSAAGTATRRFQLVPIQISGRGTFRQCTAFLHDLHQRHRDIPAWTIELADNPSDRDETLAFHFEFMWYAAPDATVATK